MARRSSEPEEEQDAGKPVEPTESMPEQDTSEQFGEKRIESMPEHDLSSHSGESANAVGNDAFFRYIDPEDTLEPIMEDWQNRPAELTSSYESSLTPAPFTDPSQPMPDDLKELDDEDDWNEPEARLDKADMHDEDEDDEDD